MKEEVILMRLELRSQINDTILRVGKESPAEGKEMVSMLISCDFVDVYDLLEGETSAFLEYMESCGFIRTEMRKINVNSNRSYVQCERVSIHEWVKFVQDKGCLCHPALIALYRNYTENS
jgi:hypothetical protein|nr:MAG TPA: hypothetical protein [Caudoviricetes sp.]